MNHKNIEHDNTPFTDSLAVDDETFYAPLTVYMPVSGSDAPYIRINGLVVRAEPAQLSALAQEYRSLVESTMDQEAAILVKGTIVDEGSYQSLELTGWEKQVFNQLWQGTIERVGEIGLMHTDDGQSFSLPDLPEDVQDGQRAFVMGFTQEAILEWTIIQDYVESSPPAAETTLLVSIEKVELAYLAPQVEVNPSSPIDPIAQRTLQPVWHFYGQAANGDQVHIYVQAVVISEERK
jgi:hypothetical protein